MASILHCIKIDYIYFEKQPHETIIDLAFNKSMKQIYNKFILQKLAF